MFLTSVIIGSTVIAAAKVYRENKRLLASRPAGKKESPWVKPRGGLITKRKRTLKDFFPQYANASSSSLRPSPRPLIEVLRAPLAVPEMAVRRVCAVEGQVSAISEHNHADTRKQQLLELSHRTDEIEISAAEKEVNRYLALATLSLALSAAGVWYPPLAWMSVPALLYLTGFITKKFFQVELKEGRIGVGLIDVLTTVGPIATGHFFATSLSLSFYFFSRKLLIKTEDHSRKSLINVFGEKPSFVWIDSNGTEIEMPFETIQIGDVVIVHAGQSIPVDGNINRGHASIDERALTGESQPVEKGVGDPVLASTVVLEGKIYVNVEKAGQDTVAAQIGEILNQTADFKSQVLARSEKMVNQGAAPTLAIAALTLPFLGTQSALAVLFASFGYHMRIAGPLSVLNFLGIASENGILIKDGRSIELLSDVDTFVFDKTGTLTEEVPTIGKLYTCHGYSENKLLTVAAAAEYKPPLRLLSSAKPTKEI